MDLPVGPFTALGQQAIEVIGRLAGTRVGPDVAGLQTVTDGQQIHAQSGDQNSEFNWLSWDPAGCRSASDNNFQSPQQQTPEICR